MKSVIESSEGAICGIYWMPARDKIRRGAVVDA